MTTKKLLLAMPLIGALALSASAKVHRADAHNEPPKPPRYQISMSNAPSGDISSDGPATLLFAGTITGKGGECSMAVLIDGRIATISRKIHMDGHGEPKSAGFSMTVSGVLPGTHMVQICANEGGEFHDKGHEKDQDRTCTGSVAVTIFDSSSGTGCDPNDPNCLIE